MFNEFLALFTSNPVSLFLQNLSASGFFGQLGTVVLLMLLTALTIAIPGVLIMGVWFLVKKCI